MHAYVGVYACACRHTCMHVHVGMLASAHTHFVNTHTHGTHACINKHTCVQLPTHTHTHTLTHTHTRRLLCTDVATTLTTSGGGDADEQANTGLKYLSHCWTMSSTVSPAMERSNPRPSEQASGHAVPLTRPHMMLVADLLGVRVIIGFRV